MSSYKKLLQNIGLFTLANVSTKLVTFLLVPLYTTFFTTSEYGISDLANVILWITMPVLTLSISDAVLRFIIEDSDNKGLIKAYYNISLYIILVSCIITFAILPLFDLTMFGGLGNYRYYYLVAYIVLAFNTFHSNVARGLNQIKLMTISSIVTAFVNIVVSVLMIALLRCSLDGFFIAYIVSFFIGNIIYLIFGKHYKYVEFKIYKVSILKRMLLYSLPLVPNTLFWWASQSVNRFFITSMIGISASGLFAVASKIPSMLNMVSGIFQQAWNISAFQELKKKNPTSFFSNVFSIYQFVIVSICAIMIPLSKYIASFLFQKEFYAAWILSPILLLSFYYSAMSAFYGTIYTSTLKTKVLFTTTVYGAILCIVLTWVLLRYMGLQGACFATMLSNVIVWIIRIIDSKKIFKLKNNIKLTVMTNIFLISSAIAMIAQHEFSIYISIIFSFICILLQFIYNMKYIQLIKKSITM